MSVYSFSVEISGIEISSAPYEDMLFNAGCDDALIAVVDQRLRVDFDREAASYEAAVASARSSLAKAGASVVSVTQLPLPASSRSAAAQS